MTKFIFSFMAINFVQTHSFFKTSNTIQYRKKYVCINYSQIWASDNADNKGENPTSSDYSTVTGFFSRIKLNTFHCVCSV